MSRGLLTEEYDMNATFVEFLSKPLPVLSGSIIGIVYDDLSALFIEELPN